MDAHSDLGDGFKGRWVLVIHRLKLGYFVGTSQDNVGTWYVNVNAMACLQSKCYSETLLTMPIVSAADQFPKSKLTKEGPMQWPSRCAIRPAVQVSCMGARLCSRRSVSPASPSCCQRRSPPWLWPRDRSLPLSLMFSPLLSVSLVLSPSPRLFISEILLYLWLANMLFPCMRLHWGAS